MLKRIVIFLTLITPVFSGASFLALSTDARAEALGGPDWCGNANCAADGHEGENEIETKEQYIEGGEHILPDGFSLSSLSLRVIRSRITIGMRGSFQHYIGLNITDDTLAARNILGALNASLPLIHGLRIGAECAVAVSRLGEIRTWTPLFSVGMVSQNGPVTLGVTGRHLAGRWRWEGGREWQNPELAAGFQYRHAIPSRLITGLRIQAGWSITPDLYYRQRTGAHAFDRAADLASAGLELTIGQKAKAGSLHIFPRAGLALPDSDPTLLRPRLGLGVSCGPIDISWAASRLVGDGWAHLATVALRK